MDFVKPTYCQALSYLTRKRFLAFPLQSNLPGW